VDATWLTRELGKVEQALRGPYHLAVRYTNALDYGADPTGARDATDQLIRAAREARDGVLLLPPGAVFKLSEALVIEHPVTILMTAATLNQTGTTQSGLYVQSSDVTVYGGTIQGPQYAAFDDDAIGIRAGERPAGRERKRIVLGTQFLQFRRLHEDDPRRRAAHRNRGLQESAQHRDAAARGENPGSGHAASLCVAKRGWFSIASTSAISLS
jgi:hypothetical protein